MMVMALALMISDEYHRKHGLPLPPLNAEGSSLLLVVVIVAEQALPACSLNIIV